MVQRKLCSWKNSSHFQKWKRIAILSLFPPDLWFICEYNDLDMPRTQNKVEARHCRWETLVTRAHVGVHFFISRTSVAGVVAVLSSPEVKSMYFGLALILGVWSNFSLLSTCFSLLAFFYRSLNNWIAAKFDVIMKQSLNSMLAGVMSGFCGEFLMWCKS